MEREREREREREAKISQSNATNTIEGERERERDRERESKRRGASHRPPVWWRRCRAFAASLLQNLAGVFRVVRRAHLPGCGRAAGAIFVPYKYIALVGWQPWRVVGCGLTDKGA